MSFVSRGNPNETQEEYRARLDREEAERQQREQEELAAQEYEEKFGYLAETPEVYQPDYYYLPEQSMSQTFAHSRPDDYASSRYRPPEEVKRQFSEEEIYWRSFGQLTPEVRREADQELVNLRETDWQGEYGDYLSQGEIGEVTSLLDAGYRVIAPFQVHEEHGLIGDPTLDKGGYGIRRGEGYDSYMPKVYTRQYFENFIKDSSGQDYKFRTSNLSEGKQLADSVYLDTLRKRQSDFEKGSKEWNDIQSLIKKGPLNFDKKSDYKLVGDNKFALEAATAQAFVMNDFLHRNDINSAVRYTKSEAIPSNTVFLNTGTLAHGIGVDLSGSNPKSVLNETLLKRIKESDNWVQGEFGKYSSYAFVEPEGEWYDDLLKFALPILNFAAPTVGKIVTGIVQLSTMDDLGDFFESAAKGYLVGQIAPDFLETNLSGIGIDADTLGVTDETFSRIAKNTQDNLLDGDNIQDSLTGAFLEEGGDFLKENILPAAEDTLKDIGGGAYEVVAEILETPKELLEETFEPILTAIGDSEIVETIEETGKEIYEATSPVLSEAEDIVKDVGRELDDVVDFGGIAKDAILSNFGVGGTNVRNIASTSGMLGGGFSQIENLFDKELFKFDEDIKSTQEMLSPIMNRRKRRYV